MVKNMTDRYIYIAFFCTPSEMGKFIRFMTGHSYNHVSLSLYRDLRVLYTFARHHKNTPFYGGFIKESLRRFPREMQTKVKVCRLRLKEEQYLALCDYLRQFLSDPDAYVYNLLSAATSVLNRRTRLSESYTCVEFVTDGLVHCGYLPKKTSSHSVKALERALHKTVVYEGSILRYPIPESWEGDNFLQPKGRVEGLQHTFRNMVRLYVMVRWERKKKNSAGR